MWLEGDCNSHLNFLSFHLKSLKSIKGKEKKSYCQNNLHWIFFSFFSLRKLPVVFFSFPHSSDLVHFNCLVKHLLLTNNTELNILPCLSDSLWLLSSLFSVGEPELLKTGPYSEPIVSAVLGAVVYTMFRH